MPPSQHRGLSPSSQRSASVSALPVPQQETHGSRSLTSAMTANPNAHTCEFHMTLAIQCENVRQRDTRGTFAPKDVHPGAADTTRTGEPSPTNRGTPLFTRCFTATAAIVAAIAAASCRPADHTEPPDQLHTSRITRAEAQGLLLRADDLPEGWSKTGTAKYAGTPVDTTGLSPAGCASAWTSLDRLQQQWDDAPVNARTAYQNTDGALVTHTITDDPDLEPDSLRRPLSQLPEACAAYRVTGPDGSPYSGGIKDLDISRDDIGLTQTWFQPDGTPTNVYFAYLIRRTTVITVRTDGGLNDLRAFIDIVDTATEKADQVHKTG